MQRTRSVYIFDLDGVVTNPRDSKVDKEVVISMSRLLMNEYLLAINTGRSFQWVEENILGQLVAGVSDEKRDNLIIICEKGGETVKWQGGRWAMQSSQFALPPVLYQKTKDIFDSLSGRLPTMFWDATKRTMATIEKDPQSDLAGFHAEQRILVDALQSGLAGMEVRIDATTIAIDIESPSAGKHAGAELIYRWCQEAAGEYFCFGDSVSDYEMARYFADQGAKVSFVYVGEPTDDILCHKDVTFIASSARFAAGVREYFMMVDNE